MIYNLSLFVAQLRMLHTGVVVYRAAIQDSKSHLRRDAFYARLAARPLRLKPSHIALSTPCSPAARRFRPPCSASQRRWRGGRQGWAHSTMLVLRAILCESGGRGTIYLVYGTLDVCNGLFRRYRAFEDIQTDTAELV